MRIKSFFKFLLLSPPLFFFIITYALDKMYFHQDWFTANDVLKFTTCVMLIIFVLRFLPEISKIKFGFFEIIRTVAEEKTTKWLIFKNYEDMIEETGMELQNIFGTQRSGDNIRKLHKISEIHQEDTLPEADKNRLRKIWNKYVLRELSFLCLAFFDKPSFGLGDERKKIRSSPDLYYPSPEKVRKFSEKAQFKEKMQHEENYAPIKQFDILFEHFNSSYQADKEGHWLNWDIPTIISEMQVKK